jgi:hypothetical protein
MTTRVELVEVVASVDLVEIKIHAMVVLEQLTEALAVVAVELTQAQAQVDSVAMARAVL